MAWDYHISEFPKHPQLTAYFKKDATKRYNTYLNAIRKQPNTPLFKYLKRVYKKK
jgi:hypothetical protein